MVLVIYESLRMEEIFWKRGEVIHFGSTALTLLDLNSEQEIYVSVQMLYLIYLLVT